MRTHSTVPSSLGTAAQRNGRFPRAADVGLVMPPPPPHPTHAALSMLSRIAQRIFVGGKDEAVEDMMFREHVEEGEITNAGLAYKPRWQEASMFQARLECSKPDRVAPSQKERDPPRPSACAHRSGNRARVKLKRVCCLRWLRATAAPMRPGWGLAPGSLVGCPAVATGARATG